MKPALVEEFFSAARGRARLDEPMRLHTTFHIGGPAEIWVEPESEGELRSLLILAEEAKLPVTVIGGGANLLVRDEGIPGMVIHLGNRGFMGVRPEASRLFVGAGLPLEWLIRKSEEEALTGVEFLAGVPGRVGGAIRMNAGTHDDEGKIHSICDVVESIRVMNEDGTVCLLESQEIGFGYRASRLGKRIVLEAVLKLLPEDPKGIRRRVQRLWEFKKKTQDWSGPSAGCIFKNPAHGPTAGWLIEQVGLKGYRRGGVQISPIHANFMVNQGNAKAADVLDLIETVREKVRREHHIELELEVQLLPKGLSPRQNEGGQAKGTVPF